MSYGVSPTTRACPASEGLRNAAHFACGQQIGDEQVASLADLASHRVVLERMPKLAEGLEPAFGVEVVRIHERAVDVEEDRFKVHVGMHSKQRVRTALATES